MDHTRKTIEKDGVILYYCSKCKTFKEENKFEHRYDLPHKLRSWCKECRNFESAYYHRTARKRMAPNEALIDIERQKRWKANPENTLRKYLLRLSKQSAKQRNLENTLTLDDILLTTECPILKRPFIIGHRWYGYSVDRVDNSKGYIKGNVKIISSLANVMKNSASKEDLKSFSENILNYIKI